MQLPQPQGIPFKNIASDIETGRLLIPQFQREFVWSMKKSAELMDSILKGYPIGTFILWRTQERMHSMRGIGGQKFPVVGKNEFVDFVLDGQQRLTSIYACLNGLSVLRDSGRTDNFKDIFVDLKACGDEPIVRSDIMPLERAHCVSINVLCGGFSTDLVKFDKKYHDKIRDYYERITAYSYSMIKLSDASLDVATEVFTRINTAGKALGLFEIMVAKTYDKKRGFDLLKKWKKLQEALESVGYGTVNSETALHTVALITGRSCTKAHIVNMDKNKFIDNWDKAANAIKRAVDYLRISYRIPGSILPYPALVASYAYFFSRCAASQSPDGNQAKLLKDFFWRVALTNRYRDGAGAKLVEDIRYMDSFWEGEKAKYSPGWGVSISPADIISNGRFVLSNAYIKAILCLYAFQKPQSFNNGNDVAMNNDWLSKATSKNYHHFFPKKFLKDKGRDGGDHVMNITMVDAALNQEIGVKPPSVYMREYQEANPSIVATMKTHLIGNLKTFGVLNDNYGKFIDERAKIVSEELSKRIIPNSMDNKPDLKK